MQLRKEAWKKKFRTWIPEFFSGFFTQLHKLRSLRRSFLHLHFISAVHIWFISYIINKVLPAIRKVKLSLPNWILVPYTYNVYQIRSNVFAQSMIFSIRESHKKCWSGTILSFKKAAPSSRRSCTTFLDLHVILKVIHPSWHKKITLYTMYAPSRSWFHETWRTVVNVLVSS